MNTIPVDPAAILAELGFADAATVVPIAAGFGDNALWRVERGGESFALRVFPRDREALWQREIAALRAAAGGSLPVPPIVAEGHGQGRPALVLGWALGRTVAEVMTRRPWQTWTLGRMLGRAQAQLHAVPATPELRAAGRDWIAWAGPEQTALADRLRALPPRPEMLLHLDYHPANIVVANGAVSGIIDWANAAAGDPRADIARTLTLLLVAPLPPEIPRLPATLARRAMATGWRRGYREIAGSPGDLTLFYAWAGAVMLRDLAPKIGRPGVWLTDRDLDPVRQFAATWRQRAGLGS